MSTETLRESDGPISVISLVSGDGRQTLDRSAYEALAWALAEADSDPATRVVMLKGMPGCFCLGGDLAEFVDPARHGGLIVSVKRLFRQLAAQRKPLFAVVDGDAVGVGCTILFHCDLVFASNRSTFRVPFVDFGLVPDAATSMLAPERFGYARAFRFFCLGETLDAAQAVAMGLVAEAVEVPLLEALGRTTAMRLARKPPEAVSWTRGLLRPDAGRVCERVDREIDLFETALAGDTTLKRLKRLVQKAA